MGPAPCALFFFNYRLLLMEHSAVYFVVDDFCAAPQFSQA
jgi:hypothetical protein